MDQFVLQVYRQFSRIEALLNSLSHVEEFLSDAGMLRTMIDNITDGVYFTDINRTIQFWNRGAEAISGYAASEVVGRRCADKILMHVDATGNCLCTSPSCPLVKCLKGETNQVDRVYMHHKDGHRVPVRICAAPIRDSQGQIIGGLETFHDISKELAALQEVDYLKQSVLLCPLTAIGNRRYCEQTLRTSLENLAPGKSSLGLLFLDVDNFKTYNDKFGHAVGDVVLKMVARTISKDLRAFDFVGRWGGEEFVVILPRILELNLEQTAQRLRLLIASSSLDVSQGRLHVTVSIGATMARPGESLDNFVDRADKLMYRSKSGGKNRVTVG